MSSNSSLYDGMTTDQSLSLNENSKTAEENYKKDFLVVGKRKVATVLGRRRTIQVTIDIVRTAKPITS